MKYGAKRTYRKNIILRYDYIDCPEGKNALAEIFDDIFKRIIQKSMSKSQQMDLNIDKCL